MRYRPIDARLWLDRRFLSLSDEGKLLWLFFLTCAAMPIPGVLIGGESAFAEQLGWPVKRYRERFQELVTAGLRVRSEGRLVWLQNALKYQPPCNPNMVKAWGKFWDDVPEGPLKRDVWQALKIACKSWSRVFCQLFPEVSGEPYAQLLLEPFPIPLHTQTLTQTQTLTPTGEEERRAQRKPKVEVPMPDGWRPEGTEGNLKAQAEAESRGVDLEVELEQFRDHALDKGRTTKDWNAAWRTWTRNARPRSGPRSAGGESGLQVALRIARGEERA